MKRWIVTAVDYSYSHKGAARVLGEFKSYDEAMSCANKGLDQWMDDRPGLNVEYDGSDMRRIAWASNNDRCEWNIEEVEVKEYEKTNH